MGPLVILALLLQQAPAPAEPLKLAADLTWGVQGPPRSTARYAARDRVHVSLRLAGLAPDKLGQVNGFFRIELRKPDGSVQNLPTRESGSTSAWRGRELRTHFNVPLEMEQPAGRYVLAIAGHDRHNGQEARLELPFEVAPREFALLGPVFSADLQGASACGPQGVVGQALFIKVGVVGHAQEQGKSRALCVAEVLDEQGAIVHELRSDPLRLAGPLLSFDVTLPLMRSGDFKLRLTVTDEIGHAARSVEVPLKVREP